MLLSRLTVFFNSQARSRHLCCFSFSFNLWVSRDSKVYNFASSLSFVDYYKVWSSGRDLVVCLYAKIPKEFMCLILKKRCLVAYIPFVRWVKFQFLAQLPVDHLADQVVSSLIFLLRYLLHSLMWLIVSSLSPHNLHLLFCRVLPILVLIWLVLVALFCVAMRRDSVSLF